MGSTNSSPCPSKRSLLERLLGESPASQVSTSNTVVNFNFACLCLNIRIRGNQTWDKVEVEELYIIHPMLVDIIYCGKGIHWLEEQYFVSCLFCQTLVYVVSFQHRTRLSVTGLIGDSFYIDEPPQGLSSAHISQALGSPYFSPTFQILLCVTSLKFRVSRLPDTVGPHRIDPALENHIYSYFSSIAIKQLCSLLERKPRTATDDARNVARRIRSDLNMFIQQLYDRQLTDPLLRTSLHVTLTEFLTPVDVELSKHAPWLDSDPVAPSDNSSFTSLWRDLYMVSPEHTTFLLSSQPSTTYPPQALAFSGCHPTTTCNFADLPAELALIIFGYICPMFQCTEIPRYYRARSYFAQLALVSRVWEPLISDILYRTLVVSLRSFLKSLPLALERHGSIVETFIIDGSMKVSSRTRRMCSNVFERCLGLTTAVSSIEFYDMHNQFPFDKHHWIQQTVPSLRQPVKSLTYQTATGAGLSLCLLGLGRDLETLNIQDWRLHSAHFSMPKNMPRLARVTLKGGDPSPQNVYSLLSRAGRTQFCDGHLVREHFVRHLSISEVQSLDETAITKILHIHNFRFHLTTLRIRLPQSREILPDACNFPLRLLDLCPSIVDFSYTSPAPPEIFMQLPQSLHSLELAIIIFDSSITPKPDMLSSADPLLDYVRPPKNSSLRKLSVVWRMCTWDDDHHKLQSVCSSARISLDCAFWFEVFSFLPRLCLIMG